MKKLLFFCFAIFVHTVNAQNFWTPTELTLTAFSEYFKPLMSVADDNTIWITNVETNGNTTWHLSANGGTSWNSGTFVLDNNEDIVFSICALSATTAYVTAGSYNSVPAVIGTGVYKTTDAGVSWIKQQGIFETPAVSFADEVHFWDENKGVVLGDPENGYFEIYTTNDAGANWTRVPTENIATPPMLNEYVNRYHVNGDTIWFLTTQQRLFRSNDNGLHWQGFNTPLMDFAPVETFEHIGFKNPNEGLLISSDWRYFKTTDGGTTWEELSNQTSGISCARNGNVWHIPETADSYFFTSLNHDAQQLGTSYSDNGGLSFQNMNLMDENPIMVTEAYFKNSNLAYSLGSYISEGGDSLNFTLFKHGASNAGFAHNLWEEINPFYTFPAYRPAQISIADANTVWVRGTHVTNPNLTQRFSRSADASLSWIDGTINVGSPNLRITSICGVSGTTAYVTATLPTGGSGGVWKTQDTGETWTKQTSALFNSATSYPEIVHFWNANDGVAIGDPEGGYFEVYTTSNGGANWTRVPAANFPALLPDNDHPILNYDAKGNSIWFVTQFDQVYRSDDKGLHWTHCPDIPRDFGGLYYTHVAFKNPSEGLIARTDSLLAHSINGGNTWSEFFPTDSYNMSGISYVPDTSNTYFSWGEDRDSGLPGSSYTTDGGMTWHNMNEEDTNPLDISSAKFHHSQMGYCIATYLGETSVKFFRLNFPGDRLLQNESFTEIKTQKIIAFPNPANGMVRLSGILFGQISIFDATGKLIFHQDYNAEPEVSINTSAFQTGIYMVKVIGDNGISETVRLLKK